MQPPWRWIFLFVVTVCAAAALLAVAVWWRWWFPYSDGIASFLSEETVAYVHLNLTAINRVASHRFVDFNVERAKDSIGPELTTVVGTALRSREVSEVALVVDEVGGQLHYAFVIGQRASDQPDVVAPDRVIVGGQSVAVTILRIPKKQHEPSGSAFEAELQPLRHRPLQVAVRPRAIVERVGGEFRALADTFPEFMAASGSFGRGGLMINSDGAASWWRFRPIKIKLPRPLLVGGVAVVGAPLRAFALLIADTLPKSAQLAIAALPERADIQILDDRSRVAARLPAERSLFAIDEFAWRALAAIIWPTQRVQLLDGLVSDVTVVDPEAYQIITVEGARWEVKGIDETVRASVVRCADSIVVASDSSADCESAVVVSIPSQCRLTTDDAVLLFAASKGSIVSMTWGADLKRWAACLFPGPD
ncbi:MAG: hypothetical protein V1723_03770 [Candidatus Uhrbacteria bacterium]